MPLDLSLPLAETDKGGFDTDLYQAQQDARDLSYDRDTAGRGLTLAQPAAAPTGYATPQHAGVSAIRGYDPLRVTADWSPDVQYITPAFNPFPNQDSPKDKPGEWNYLWQTGKNVVLGLGDAGVNLGRMLNTAIGDMTTEQGGGNEWLEGQLAGWHQAIAGTIADNIKKMGDGYRNAYEGSILRSLGVDTRDAEGNPIPGVFEGGGGVGRFANWAAAQVAGMIPIGVVGLLTGGTGAAVLMGAQTMGDLYGRAADHVANTDDATYQATNPIYRDLRQNQGMSEMQAKHEMLQHAMLSAIAGGAATGVAGKAGFGSSAPAWGPVMRRVWGAIVGGGAFGTAGGASSVVEQRLMTGDVDVTTAMREALTQGAQGAVLGGIFGAHAREEAGREKPSGEPNAGTKGVDADTAEAIAATRPRQPEQMEMFASPQMGPTVAPSPPPRPTEPYTTQQPTGAAPITPGQQPGQPPTLERTPGPYAPQTYPAYGPQGPTIVSRPEGAPGAPQPALFPDMPEQGPSGPIVPPSPRAQGGGGAGGGPGAPGAAAPRAATPTPTSTPAATEAAVATSKARGKGKGQGQVTPGVTPTPGAGETGLADLGGAGRAIGENLRDMLWQRHQAGEITEPGNIPSNILNAADWLKKQGVVTDRASFNEFLDAYGAAGDAVRTKEGFNKFLADYAEANRPEAGGEAAPAAPVAPAAPAEPKLTPYQMRQQLIEWGYKRSQVKAMRVADVTEAHAKGPEGAPARAAEAKVQAAEKAPPGEQLQTMAPEGEVEPTLAATQAEPVTEAERVPESERTLFPAQPKEEGPPIAEPLTGRALEKARLAAGKEIPVKGEAAVAEERAPEEVHQGQLELAAPENTPENRREAMHAMVQEHAPQVIQARGKAPITAVIKRASDYLHRLIEETDGTREGVAERINAALESLPKESMAPMPGTTISWRNYIAQMMTRLTGHEPTSAEAERAEIEQVQRTEQARQGAEPVRKLSGEDIEQAVAAPVEGEGAEMAPVARKAEAASVTNVKRKAANLIKRLRDGDLTPAEAAIEYDKPVEGETRGAKRSKGYGTFREVLMTRLAEAADETAERRILDEIHRVENNRELTAAQKNPMRRKLMNDLSRYGRDVANELQDWLERLDDPVGKALDDEEAPGKFTRSEMRNRLPEGIDPMSSRYATITDDPRLVSNFRHWLEQRRRQGTKVTADDVLRFLRDDPLVRNEAPAFARLITQLIRLAPQHEVVSPGVAHLLYQSISREKFEELKRGEVAGIHMRSDVPEYSHTILPETATLQTVVHELLHSATQPMLDHLVQTDPMHPIVRAITLMRHELIEHLRDAINDGEFDGRNAELGSLEYALQYDSNTGKWLGDLRDVVNEVHTGMLTNPTLQAFMASRETSAFVRQEMRKLGFPYRPQGASVWRTFTDWVRKALGFNRPASASEYTMLDHFLQASTDITEEAGRYNERMLPQDPLLNGPATASYRAARLALGPRARQTMDRVTRTADFARLNDAKRSFLMRFTPLDRLVERFGDALPAIHVFRTANEMMRYAGKKFSDTYADDIKTVARRIVKADDRQGLQALMNDATMNEAALRPGGDNSHLTTPEQQRTLQDLRTRYNNLSTRDKETYGLTADLHSKMFQEIRDAQLRSMVNIHMPDATEKETEDFVKAARTQDGLDQYVEDTKQAHRDVVRAIADFHKLGYVNGDYFPLRRYGNYVVRYGDRDDLNSYGVEFFENRAKAEARRKELLAQNVPDVYRVDSKDDRPINELAPSHPAVETLINRLSRSGFDQAQQDMVREQMSRIMVQQATRSARSRLQQTYRRRGIRGASEYQARALISDFISNSQTIGHLLWGPARARALVQMRNDVENLSRPGAPDTSLHPVTARTVADEMARRSNRLNDPDNVAYKVLRGVNLFNYLHSLDSLSHMVSSTMEAHTNSVALGGARYGYWRFSGNLTKALMHLTPKMAATGFMNTIKGVGGELKATDWNLAHIARDRLIAAGANASHMNRLFDAAEKAGLIDHTIMTDLRIQYLSPTGLSRIAQEGVNRFMILTQAGAHATDVMNKSAIMKAAFDSHLGKNPGDVDGAIAAGLEYARKSMPNYNMANRGSIDRYLGPLLQFKRYGIHMYSLIGNLAREAMHGDHKWESAKALAGLTLTHAMMAGAITTIADPLRYFMGAYDLLTTGKTKDRQAAVRGWLSDTFGQTMGEIIGRGVPHALGIDMRHRVGLENLLELPELGGLDKNSIGQFLLGLLSGATGESLIDQGVALGKLTQGDVGGFLKGVVPRLLRDPMKAFDLAEKGVTDARGKTLLPASRLSAGDVAAQALGFQPATVSEFREGRNAALAQREELTSEHSRLEQRWLNASADDRRSIMDEIHRFNADETTRRWGMQLTMDQLLRAQAAGRKAERSPFGLRLPAKSVQGARYVGRFANIGSPIPAAP